MIATLTALYRVAWKGSAAQWVYLAILVAAVAGIVCSLVSTMRVYRTERQLLRAVLAMARVGDAAAPRGRQGGRSVTLPAEAAAVLPAEVAPPPRRMANAVAAAAAPELGCGQSTVGELGAAGKMRATPRRQRGP